MPMATHHQNVPVSGASAPMYTHCFRVLLLQSGAEPQAGSRRGLCRRHGSRSVFAEVAAALACSGDLGRGLRSLKRRLALRGLKYDVFFLKSCQLSTFFPSSFSLLFSFLLFCCASCLVCVRPKHCACPEAREHLQPRLLPPFSLSVSVSLSRPPSLTRSVVFFLVNWQRNTIKTQWLQHVCLPVASYSRFARSPQTIAGPLRAASGWEGGRPVGLRQET